MERAATTRVINPIRSDPAMPCCIVYMLWFGEQWQGHEYVAHFARFNKCLLVTCHCFDHKH